MTGVEILLLVVGVVFLIASFFITEKLSPDELRKIGDLSNDEIQKVMERELLKVTGEIEGRVEEKVEEALEKSEHSMEKECNDKINIIGEYSDTVVETMNKTHNEIMFLYSMLNDKHVELTQLSSRLQELANDLEEKDQKISSNMVNRMNREETILEPMISVEEPDISVDDFFEENILVEEEVIEPEVTNHNEKILDLHEQGKSDVEIAKELGRGLGEVQLVIGLFEGKRKQ